MSKHATFKDLIARKLEREKRENNTYEISVEGMESPLLMNHPPASLMLEMLEGVTGADSLEDVAELYVRLIYDCCPVFQRKETQEALEVVDPYDAIRHVFDKIEILRIGDRFCEACGIFQKNKEAGKGKDESLADTVKN